jgi:hypothetical protein
MHTFVLTRPRPFRLSLSTKGWSHDQSEQDVKDFFEESLVIHRRDTSVYKTKIKAIWWSFHIEHITNPRDISEEGSWTRRWSNYYVEEEVAQHGSNRGVWSAIANQPVARSGTEVHQDWWRVQRLVTMPQFFLDRGSTKNKGSIKLNNP